MHLQSVCLREESFYTAVPKQLQTAAEQHSSFHLTLKIEKRKLKLLRKSALVLAQLHRYLL